MKNIYSQYVLLLALLTPFIAALDNPHFYRSTNFLSAFHEPRLTKNWLNSIDISLFGGSSSTSRVNRNKKCDTENCSKTCLLNICGFHNMHQLGAGVPNKDHNDPIDALLISLGMIPARGNFGKLKFSGKFSFFEGSFTISQNFVRGFFTQIHLPIRQLKIDDICFTDQSPTDNLFPNKKTPEWQAFLNSFDAVLSKYCLNLCPENKTKIGDTSFYLGWTHTYLDTEVIDFLDVTLKLGVLVPTGDKKDLGHPFDLPNGYNGHVGVPFSFATAIGLYEWLNIGAQFNVMPFVHKTKTLRMKTDSCQNGFIRLACGQATISPGPLWGVTGYLKADHFAHGFSFLVGYSFNNKRSDDVCPCNLDIFTPSIAQSACEFQGWKMHTLHLLAEYEFTLEQYDSTARIGAFYNLNVGGERIFKTHTYGGLFGIDMGWEF